MDTYNAENDFKEKSIVAQKNFCKRPNILVCGGTGSGKTTLIRSILGDLVHANKIGNGAPKTMDYDLYENDFVRIWDSKGLEIGETEVAFTEQTKKFVDEKRNDTNPDNHIHLVWYTIQGSGARVTQCDINLIRNIFKSEYVIVAITKKDITRPNQLAAISQTLIDSGIPNKHIVAVSDVENNATNGCMELTELSLTLLPSAYQDAFVFAQKIDLDRKIQVIYDQANEANKIIAAATVAAAGIGAVPIPIADAVLLMPAQVTMIAGLARIYGLREEAVNQLVLPLVARFVGMYAASSLLKIIPILGSAINATVAASLTGAMGYYLKNIFEAYAIAKVKGDPTPNIGINFDLLKRCYDEYRKITDGLGLDTSIFKKLYDGYMESK